MIWPIDVFMIAYIKIYRKFLSWKYFAIKKKNKQKTTMAKRFHRKNNYSNLCKTLSTKLQREQTKSDQQHMQIQWYVLYKYYINYQFTAK